MQNAFREHRSRQEIGVFRLLFGSGGVDPVGADRQKPTASLERQRGVSPLGITNDSLLTARLPECARGVPSGDE